MRLFLVLSSLHIRFLESLLFFFFNDTATTEIYTLSLHDALPICNIGSVGGRKGKPKKPKGPENPEKPIIPVNDAADRKSTRLNSSHLVISYAVFCLKKKKKT